ncbi:VWA domain-containing protein [Rhizobium sp. TH2]|uniref:VWA domain-containing protein n=1 Tax=Rhizobium sp. TH2 TaxID=2775403 RepID=UPI0021580050|nr:VWA domain-containing protein [Rhizobium sp. TH2]UVC09846.1 VWA domain-containing protein [Rhizobium sp. TH2]
MAFAIISVPLLGGMGVAFDYTMALNTHREMQSSLDAALVAAIKQIEAKNKDEKSIRAHMENWLAAEAQSGSKYKLDTNSIVIDFGGQDITATAQATVPTSFLKILGVDTVPVSVQASVLGGADIVTKTAFSMYLVLDRSGSMDYPTTTAYTTTCMNASNKPYICTKVYKKIEALKLATSDLLTQFVDVDPDLKYVRTGGVSYNNAMQTPSDLNWGTSAILQYVNALTATGTTNSGEAMEEAYESLKDSDEDKAHKDKNGTKKPDKYIVLMTDGENNVNGADAKTKKYCDKAKTQKMTVYSIAFMAPAAGEALLKYCATSSAHYFSADNTKELVAAFKLIGATAAKTLVRLTN